MSKIQWTDETWNPVTGCTKVSTGCKNCYAETVARRWWGDRKFTDVRCHPERLVTPLRWRKPRRVFVNSMSDLFHPAVPTEFLASVFGVMAAAESHVFQLLTKRPDRMQHLLQSSGFADDVCRQSAKITGDPRMACHFWPLRNVWLGVSCENQETADGRIPILLDTPAAVRFVSAEPLLGPIDLGAHVWRSPFGKVDWVICGGESGPKARPCDVAWIRSIVKLCKAAKVPVFVKQMGAHSLSATKADHKGRMEQRYPLGSEPTAASPWRMWLYDRKGGDPTEWPEDLRVREWPTTAAEVRG